MKKNRKKLFIISGCLLMLLAFVPTFLVALRKQLEGRYGEAGENFWSQPLHPLIIVITIVVIFVLFPVVLYKSFKKKDK